MRVKERKEEKWAKGRVFLGTQFAKTYVCEERRTQGGNGRGKPLSALPLFLPALPLHSLSRE